MHHMYNLLIALDFKMTRKAKNHHCRHHHHPRHHHHHHHLLLLLPVTLLMRFGTNPRVSGPPHNCLKVVTESATLNVLCYPQQLLGRTATLSAHPVSHRRDMVGQYTTGYQRLPHHYPHHNHYHHYHYHHDNRSWKIQSTTVFHSNGHEIGITIASCTQPQKVIHKQDCLRKLIGNLHTRTYLILLVAHRNPYKYTKKAGKSTISENDRKAWSII